MSTSTAALGGLVVLSPTNASYPAPRVRFFGSPFGTMVAMFIHMQSSPSVFLTSVTVSMVSSRVAVTEPSTGESV